MSLLLLSLGWGCGCPCCCPAEKHFEQAHRAYIESTEHRSGAFKTLTTNDAAASQQIEQRMKKLAQMQVRAGERPAVGRGGGQAAEVSPPPLPPSRHPAAHHGPSAQAQPLVCMPHDHIPAWLLAGGPGSLAHQDSDQRARVGGTQRRHAAREGTPPLPPGCVPALPLLARPLALHPPDQPPLPPVTCTPLLLQASQLTAPPPPASWRDMPAVAAACSGRAGPDDAPLLLTEGGARRAAGSPGGAPQAAERHIWWLHQGARCCRPAVEVVAPSPTALCASSARDAAPA